MADIVTKQELIDAKIDTKDLGEALNEKKVVNPRYGAPFKSLPLAIQEVIETGGFEPFATEAELLASTPLLAKKAAKALDTGKIWLWEVGAWIDTGLSELDQAINYVDESINNIEDEKILVVADSNGFVGLSIEKDSIHLPNLSISENLDIDDFVIADQSGNIAFSSKKLKAQLDKLNQNNYESHDYLVTKLEMQSLAYSQNISNTIVTEVQKPTFDYNIVITYGQSLSTASEGWPVLSKTPIEPANVLMFGQAVRSLDYEAAEWRPVGSETLTGLKAVVQKRGVADAYILTDSEVAALPIGDQNYGESFDVGAVNFWREMQNDYFGITSNPEKKIIVLNCGVEGRTIQQLSKGAAPDLFSRMTIAATKLKTHIASINPNATVGLVAVLHAQGEYDYVTKTSEASFLSLTKQLKNDITSDVAAGIFNQKKPPAFITYQTSASWGDDSTNLAVSNAQLDMSETESGCWLSAPCYHVTDKGGHLDSNGYRWLGMHFGQVLHRVLDRGLQWKPLKPLTSVRLGKEVYINFHVPKPPLKFKHIYEVLTKKDFLNKGFRLTKNGVEVAISSIEIVGSCTLKITTAVDIQSGTVLWYAPKTSSYGAGNLCDSDSTVAAFNYEYQSGIGHYAAANIPELVNKPYPLNNFCTSFTLTLE